ncbi:hypothetical protein [Nesterenkonia sphaerica]|uniref:Uncharacterized protein n=1 Tax=Nesterenkonia sphaerica TaxID=1804988 RepID=A0A5R9AMJ0_9MICC|nr:hypothetical protein [Nesterenkonia sphaerica]TLP80038.1 hypothetical protein FEF27_01290 [Nesterenkonia sphaerica]
MRPRRLNAWMSTGCVAALLLSSCGMFDDADEDSPEENEAEAGEDQDDVEEASDATDGAPETETHEDGEEQASASGEIAQAQDGSRAVPPEEAIASIEYELSEDDSVIVSVATLEETEEFLLMEVYYWPQLERSGEGLTIHAMLGEQASNTPGPLPRIYDRENLKIYRPFHHNDTTGAFGSPSAGDGEAIYWWGFFPLLEDSVDSVDIEFASERPRLEDVPFPDASGETGDGPQGEEDGN